MRFRRRSGGRRRRRVWLEGIAPSIGQTTWHTATGGNYVASEIISSSQIKDDLDGDGTLLRLVGDLSWEIQNTGGTPTAAGSALYFGIMQMTEDQNGAVASTVSPINTVGQEFRWLWTKAFYLPSIAAGQIFWLPNCAWNAGNGVYFPTQGNSPLQANIDINVKRRLKTGNPIIFNWDLSFLPNTVSVTGLGYLRALCSH